MNCAEEERQAVTGTMAKFADWFMSGRVAGSIPSDAKEIDWVDQFCREHMESSCSKEFLEKRAIRELEKQGKCVTVSDGTDKGSLRVWLEAVGEAGEISGAGNSEIAKFALANSRGNLRKVIFSAWKENCNVSWEALKSHITSTLLTADEMTYLRDQVTNMFQLQHEEEPSYCQRFWDAVYKAWPPQLMDEQILTMLLSQFANSLRDPQTRWHVRVQNPSTIEEAIRLANSSGRAQGPQRMTRADEPMEVGASQTSISRPHVKFEKEENTVRTVQGEVKGWGKRVTRLEEMVADVCAANTELMKRWPDRNQNQTEENRRNNRDGYRRGKPRGEQHPTMQGMRCFACQGPHLVRDCDALREFQRSWQSAPTQAATFNQGN